MSVKSQIIILLVIERKGATQITDHQKQVQNQLNCGAGGYSDD